MILIHCNPQNQQRTVFGKRYSPSPSESIMSVCKQMLTHHHQNPQKSGPKTNTKVIHLHHGNSQREVSNDVLLLVTAWHCCLSLRFEGLGVVVLYIYIYSCLIFLILYTWSYRGKKKRNMSSTAFLNTLWWNKGGHSRGLFPLYLAV